MTQLNNVGMVTSITLYQPGREVGGKRITVTPFSPEQAVLYAGTYLSEELGAFYSVRYRSGQLLLQHRRYGDIPLTYLIGDTFRGDRWWLRSLRFIKDEEGRVTGFALTGERVRDLMFSKVTPVN